MSIYANSPCARVGRPGRPAAFPVSVPDAHTLSLSSMDLPDAPAVRAAVLDLLARAAGRPCAHGAQAFGALVPPPARFAVALRVLLPVADGSAGAEVCAPVVRF
jgi:hypothetical protein